jgi:hypothetical protein
MNSYWELPTEETTEDIYGDIDDDLVYSPLGDEIEDLTPEEIAQLNEMPF